MLNKRLANIRNIRSNLSATFYLIFPCKQAGHFHHYLYTGKNYSYIVLSRNKLEKVIAYIVIVKAFDCSKKHQFLLPFQITIKMKYHNLILITILLSTLWTGCTNNKVKDTDFQVEFLSKDSLNLLDQMKIWVPKDENRAISFTNKKAAYYYTQSHEANHPEHAWFEGLNIAKKRIFSGYELFIQDSLLDNKKAEVWVYPYKMERKHTNGFTEEFWMFDQINALQVSFPTAGVIDWLSIKLKGDKVKLKKTGDRIAYFSSNEGNMIIAVATINARPLSVKGKLIKSDAKTSGFYIVVAKTTQKAAELMEKVRKNAETLKQQRKVRLQKLLMHHTFLRSKDDTLQLAMDWLSVTMDQLVTQQQGYGIYAGLPWFNEYWGRDEFIALPGACLVTGQFATAKKIIRSFLEYQQKDSTSRYFGRVPNIVNPELVDYHTTDGTPRLIAQIKEYVKYTGDRDFIKQVYPNVQYSIEGALKYWVDSKGYLLHEDNETWMDARRNYDKKPYSPRGTRANDIQALWYNQLLAGIYFAKYMNDTSNAQKWQAIANKLKVNFAKDYYNAQQAFLADRLDTHNVAEFKLRPNQLFALNMIDNQKFNWKTTRLSWEELVYPWGVASLNRQDTFFHPYHLKWENYHKDEAYHNGTVWLWNNGIAMQRMIEAGQQDIAYGLFRNMNFQALTRGVVGGLGENMDAYPHPGKQWAKLTGTYLQAWSNSEHLRVWYQYFLGIRPDMVNNKLTIAPRIPQGINYLHYTFLVGNGKVQAVYQKNENTTVYSYRLQGVSSNISFDLSPYVVQKIALQKGEELRVTESGGQLQIKIIGVNGEVKKTMQVKPDAQRQEIAKKQQAIFKGTQFCQPFDPKKHKVLTKKFTGDRGV